MIQQKSFIKLDSGLTIVEELPAHLGLRLSITWKEIEKNQTFTKMSLFYSKCIDDDFELSIVGLILSLNDRFALYPS